MMNSTELHAYADGELTAEQVAEIKAAIKANPRLAAELDAIRNLKDILKDHSIRHSNDECWKACVGRINELDRSRRVESFIGRYAWGMCTVLFAFIVGGRFIFQQTVGDTVDTPSLARIIGGSMPRSTSSSLESSMTQSLFNQLKSNVNERELEIFAPQPGVAMGFPAYRVLMRDVEGDMTLVRIDGMINVQDTMSVPNHPDMVAGAAEGANLVIWHSGGRTWLLSGKREIDALGNIAEQISRTVKAG